MLLHYRVLFQSYIHQSESCDRRRVDVSKSPKLDADGLFLLITSLFIVVSNYQCTQF